MKISTRLFFLVLLLALVFALPGSALAKSTFEDQFVFGDTYTLKSGDTLNGNLVVFGGNARLEDRSQVNGDVVIMGGNVNAAGKVNGNIVVFGGNGTLESTAVVTGNVTTFGGNLKREEGSVVQGEVSSGQSFPMPFVFPRLMAGGGVDRFSPFRVFLDMVWFLFRTFMWAALAVLLMMFLPRQVGRTAHAAVAEPLISAGVGLLTAIVVPILMVVMAITICLIPVSLLAAVLLVVAWAFGLISLGYEVGRRLAEALNQTWAPPAAAGIGTFVLMFIVDGISTVFNTAGYMVPGIRCLSWILPFLTGIIGLGAVLLTRFGTADYPLLSSLSPAGPRSSWPPPAGPVPPAAPPYDTGSGPTASDYPSSEEEIPPTSSVGIYPAPPLDEELPPPEEDQPLEP